MRIRFKKLDDEMHFWAGMVISLATFIPLTLVFPQWLSAVIAYLFVIIGAVGKEYYDEHFKNGRFNNRDLKWTLIGGAIVPFIFIIADIIYYFSKL
jgi:hypothetical protein